ncbi:MAG TPA: M56 family metallopeptidase [Gemmatimonadales bacterium]|nr:M56 family metallopeptidase [Gemmatimonadales bacterium]
MIAFLADAFVKATIILLVAGVVALTLRHSAAALRHLVWALACGGVLALPVVAKLVPNWAVAGWPRLETPSSFKVDVEPVPAAAAPRAAPLASVTPPAGAPRPFAEPDRAAVTATAGTDQVRFHIRTSWTTWIVPMWLSGVGLVLMLLGIGLARITWLASATPPMLDDDWLLLLEELSREVGVHRHVRLLHADGPAMPMTWGIRRPTILLPAEATDWPLERRRDVLLHELAHVKRHDFATQLIARLACAVYWFNPLVWLAATRLRDERERACDDQVLRAGSKPSAYATHLLEIARGLRAASATSLASVAMARPAQLATRLIDVLDAGRRRDTLSPRSAVPAWIAAVAIVVPLAAAAPRIAHPAPVAASIDTTPMVPAPHVAGRVTARVPARVVRAAAVDTLPGCSGRSEHTSTGMTEENENMLIFTNLGGCSIRFAATGKFTLTDDFSDIATVASGVRVTIEVDYGDHDRRLTIQRGDGNTLERNYRVDGTVKPYDAEAQAWLTQTLTYLMRHTGFQAEARAQWILKTKGIQGLMDELGQLSGDYTRRVYYQAAIGSGKLDPAGYERLVTMAGQTISSDYELAEVLIAAAQAQPLTAGMQQGFITAAKQIGSDYERHRVLKAALSRPGLTAETEAAMLDAASGIGSDYELATLLIEVNDARPIDEAVRAAYFKAANSIGSDYEHGRVLTAVVHRTGTTPAMLADVLLSAKTISSDYELAQVLTEVSGAAAIDDAMRPAFFAAANTIGSDYDHARVLASVLEHRPVSQPLALAVLESAKGVNSDHERAELLIAVINKVRIDDTIRAAVRAAAQGIGSQYDRGRVYDALESRSGKAQL